MCGLLWRLDGTLDLPLDFASSTILLLLFADFCYSVDHEIVCFPYHFAIVAAPVDAATVSYVAVVVVGAVVVVAVAVAVL